MYRNVFTPYLSITICELLITKWHGRTISISKQTTHPYRRVTMRHIVGSYGQAMIYIHQWQEAGNRWLHVYWKYQIKSIINVLAHLISIYTYINSLKHISHHHIIFTHYHLHVGSNVMYDSILSKETLPNKKIA